MMLKLHKMKEKKGFTLIELMIVVAILGVLAAVAIPQYLQYIATTKRRATLENYENARRVIKGEYARIDAGNTARTPAELVAELNGETWVPATATFDGVPINFNPYKTGDKTAFAFQNAIAAAPGQTGVTCTYAGGVGGAPVSGVDSCTVSVFYVEESGVPVAAPVTSLLNYD